jgi:hypothetical protein
MELETYWRLVEMASGALFWALRVGILVPIMALMDMLEAGVLMGVSL